MVAGRRCSCLLLIEKPWCELRHAFAESAICLLTDSYTVSAVVAWKRPQLQYEWGSREVVVQV